MHYSMDWCLFMWLRKEATCLWSLSSFSMGPKLMPWLLRFRRSSCVPRIVFGDVLGNVIFLQHVFDYTPKDSYQDSIQEMVDNTLHFSPATSPINRLGWWCCPNTSAVSHFIRECIFCCCTRYEINHQYSHSVVDNWCTQQKSVVSL